MSKVSEKIERLGAQMLLAYPWWASLYLQLRRVEVGTGEGQSNLPIPTMAVDGTHLYYNAEFTLSLTDSECMAVLLHEVAHIALLHCYRVGGRHRMIWNIAADEKVNALLTSDGIVLPKNCIEPTSLEETVEEAYDRLLKSAVKIDVPLDVLSPGEQAPGEKGEEQNTQGGSGTRTEQDWRDALAQNRGLMPKSLSRVIEEVMQPTIDWREVLSRFIYATHRGDKHTWMRPSRRIAGAPGWDREPESNIAVCIDTSGSINDKVLSSFLGELTSICSVGGIRAYLVSCDAEVHQVIEPGEPFPSSWIGGGGTDFRPAIALAESKDVQAVIYFTDGEGVFPSSCDVPVLWALTKKTSVPFGETVLLKGSGL